VCGLSLNPADRFGTRLEAIDLDVRAGEIVGIAGVSGNGQQELVAAIAGEDPRAAREAIALFGVPVGDAPVRARRALGLHYVPEERLGRGAVPSLSLAQNMLLTRAGRRLVAAGGWIRRGPLAGAAQTVIDRFAVRAAGADAPAGSLSGGNLQKFIVGREVDARPALLLVAQPTWGVDVGAAARIRAELRALRDAGCALLVVSEELEELFEIADRLHVIARGMLSPSVRVDEASVESIGEWMSGLWPAGAAVRDSAVAAQTGAAAGRGASD